jgi:hypothetical protein
VPSIISLTINLHSQQNEIGLSLSGIKVDSQIPQEAKGKERINPNSNPQASTPDRTTDLLITSQMLCH